eukprot:TRINITY_DN9560_c1_g2_i2.p1 TRINITY_DN9560_c1_g2~~TRINITY_DN9560_c1_g2_i2.p1  ORF type:complete len:206 (+),score=51.80 TRINITY_DN9560_c1_g2_i2:25-618(+)
MSVHRQRSTAPLLWAMAVVAALAVLVAGAGAQGPPPLLPDPLTMDFTGRWGKAINGTLYQNCLQMLARVDANATIDGSPLQTIYVDRFPANAVQYQYDSLHGCRVVQYAGAYCGTRLMPYSSIFKGTVNMKGEDVNLWTALLKDGTTLNFWADAESGWPVKLESVSATGSTQEITFSNIETNVNINVFNVPSSWRCL